ncbi:MAG: HAMP domain-containing sensor histidine kinase [Actinomycetota bacterium]
MRDIVGPAPSPEWDREEVERVIALIRFLIVVSVAGLQLFGTRDVRPYPVALWVVVGVAVTYSLFVAARLRLFLNPIGRWILTGTDAVLSLLAVAFSGGARSPALAILILAVSSWAMRFDLVLALLAAALDGSVLAVVILTVPEPDLGQAERLQAAVWWPCYLLFGALLTGILSRVERTEHTRAVVAQAGAAQEREHRERLEGLERQRQELLQVITHEFRTPVASLQALTQHLAWSATPEGDRVGRGKTLGLIKTHADHLAAMVDALHEVAGSRDPDALSRVQLSDVFLGDLLEQAVSAAGPGSSRVCIRVDPGIDIVRVDPPKVRRIVTNLVENALRHSDEDSPVEVVAQRGDGRLELLVLDRGPGLPPQQASLAFDKFAGFGERRGTSGLGLWIVDQLSTSLGGWVEAGPREGAGLQVRVVLPLRSRTT